MYVLKSVQFLTSDSGKMFVNKKFSGFMIRSNSRSWTVPTCEKKLLHRPVEGALLWEPWKTVASWALYTRVTTCWSHGAESSRPTPFPLVEAPPATLALVLVKAMWPRSLKTRIS
jgi:hypothetical protein